ncbi:MAG: hypothetical protein V4620_03855 [Bacteroidota bacterium]
MKRKILTGLACLLLFGMAYAKTKKPAPTTKQTNTPVEPPIIGEWMYGKLRVSDDGWMRCERGDDKCAFIVKQVAGANPVSNYYVYLNTSQNSTTPEIKKYAVDDVLFDTNENGEATFKTVPPIQLN